MNCPRCGVANRSEARACRQCGEPLLNGARGPAAAPPAAPPPVRWLDAAPSWPADGTRVAAPGRPAQFLRRPFGQMAALYDALGPGRAAGVGLTCALASLVATGLGLWLYIRRSVPWPLLSLVGEVDLPAGSLLKMVLVALIPFVSLVIAMAVARMIFRGSGRLEGDVFVAGAAMLPVGGLAFCAGLLGLTNVEAVSALGVIALCWTLLILFVGCTQVARMSADAAALAVPAMLLISGWLATVLLRMAVL